MNLSERYISMNESKDFNDLIKALPKGKFKNFDITTNRGEENELDLETDTKLEIKIMLDNGWFSLPFANLDKKVRDLFPLEGHTYTNVKKLAFDDLVDILIKLRDASDK